MMDLRELYEEIILDHNRNPRNYPKRPEGCNHSAEGHNPLCGDRLTVYAETDDDTITDASFVGDGCAISKASASLMTQAVKGKSLTEAREMFRTFQQLVTGQITPEEAKPVLGKLVLFAGVSEFPVRVKCASLSWHTLNAALQDSGETIKTE